MPACDLVVLSLMLALMQETPFPAELMAPVRALTLTRVLDLVVQLLTLVLMRETPSLLVLVENMSPGLVLTLTPARALVLTAPAQALALTPVHDLVVQLFALALMRETPSLPVPAELIAPALALTLMPAQVLVLTAPALALALAPAHDLVLVIQSLALALR
jgi:hypothetical protein